MEFNGKRLAFICSPGHPGIYTDDDVKFALKWLPEVVAFCDGFNMRAMGDWIRVGKLHQFEQIARARNLI
jgi:hypothetical protein